MPKTSTLIRLQRLEQLTLRLQSGDPVTVALIADELGISLRTLHRDLQLLRDQGLPLETERGRGGGVRLAQVWHGGRIQFSPTEAVDLFITLAIAEQMQSPLFMTNLTSIKRKLMASLPPDLKTRVRRLKQRILISPSASIEVLSGFKTPAKTILEPLHAGFLLQNKLCIQYRAQNGEVTERTIQPQYLLLSYPVWYVMAWDELRQDIRTFRCDRILKTERRSEEFKLKTLKEFEQTIAGLEVI